MNCDDPFETIVSEHYEPLYRFAMSLTRSESDAMDLTQHTFYVWAKKGHQLRDPSKIKTWLYTTLHRAFLQSRRREVRYPHSELDETSDELPKVPPASPSEVGPGELLSALGKVNKVFQSAVALFYLDERSYTEIASILEVPIGTVKSRIARGVMQLRQILLPNDSPESLRETETASTHEMSAVTDESADRF